MTNKNIKLRKCKTISIKEAIEKYKEIIKFENMENLYKKLEEWFEKRHDITKKIEYTSMPDCSLGDRFEEIRDFLNFIGLDCDIESHLEK